MAGFASPYEIVRDIRGRAEDLRAEELDIARRRLGPIGRWHTIGAPGEPAWENGWHDYTSPTGIQTAPPGFLLDGASFVSLRGRMAGVFSLAGVVAFTLPPDFRPPDDIIGVVYAFTVPAGFPAGIELQIHAADGTVRVEASGTPQEVGVLLDARRFRTR